MARYVDLGSPSKRTHEALDPLRFHLCGVRWEGFHFGLFGLLDFVPKMARHAWSLSAGH
jgi:hypothetical protein